MSGKKAAQTLMDEMGAPREDGYNTIPPRSHRWMMDVGELLVTRVHGWGLWRTIDYDAKGRTGPKKTRRTAAAWDERGYLELKHLAQDLDVTVAEAQTALRHNVEKGTMRVDEKGRIYVCGDAPLPQRIHAKPNPEGGEDKWAAFFCTEKMPPTLIQCFQSLDEKRRGESRRLYEAMPPGYSAHLKRLDPQDRTYHTWRYLQAAEFKERLAADAMAAARAKGDEFIEQEMKASGYADDERRGRKPKPRTAIARLTLVVEPEFFSVQKTPDDSVQNGNPNLYGNQNGSVQKDASLFVSSEFSEFSELASADAPRTKINPASELALAVREAVHRSRLKWLGEDEKALDDVTAATIASSLEPLAGEPVQVRQVLDIVEDKCSRLSQRPREAREKTWGWVVGMVRSEVRKRLKESTDDFKEQLHAAAAAKGMR